MTRKLTYSIIWVALLAPVSLLSQFTLQPKQVDGEPKGIIYDKEWAVDFRLHTAGYGLGFSWGSIDAFDKTQFYSISLDFLRHPKEFRQNIRPSIYNPLNRPFVFGKQNSFFSLKGGIGKKVFLSEKAKRRGLAVGYTYQGGISLGMLKPYYLEVINYDNIPIDPIMDIKYTEETAERFLDINEIEGSSGFFKGLGETSFLPGVYGRASVHFAWGAYDEYVKALDIGIMLELYPREVPIMLIADNDPYFINLYLNLQLGKRN